MSAEEFLRSTPQEIAWKLEAYNETRNEQIALNWQLGQLIGYAFHDPKHYPALSKFIHEKANVNDEEMRRQAANIGLRIPD